MTKTITIDNRGRATDILIVRSTPYARIVIIESGSPDVGMFTADELRELADAMDALPSHEESV